MDPVQTLLSFASRIQRLRRQPKLRPNVGEAKVLLDWMDEGNVEKLLPAIREILVELATPPPLPSPVPLTSIPEEPIIPPAPMFPSPGSSPITVPPAPMFPSPGSSPITVPPAPMFPSPESRVRSLSVTIPSTPPKPTPITVDTSDGDTIVFDVTPTDKVSQLREAISQRKGVPVDFVDLYSDGVTLRDNEDLLETWTKSGQGVISAVFYYF